MASSKLSVCGQLVCILRLYNSPASDALRLSLADVFRWSTGWDSRGLKVTFLVLLLLARKELWGYRSNLGKRTIFTRHCSTFLWDTVIFQLTFLVGLLGICLLTPDGNAFGHGLW